MKASVQCVYDEGSLPGTRLIGAKGLSIAIDVDDIRILFDVGRRGNYLKNNMDHLEMSPESITAVVISHGHADHTGALNQLVGSRETPIIIYAHPKAWEQRSQLVAGLRIKDVGPPVITEENAERADMIDVEGTRKLSDNLSIIHLPTSLPSKKYGVFRDGEWQDDTFEDEIALVLRTRKGAVLICGCCHCGLIPAIDKVREETGQDVRAVVGGVHLVRSKKDELDALADALIDRNSPLLYLCHCAEENSKTKLRTKLGLNGVRDFYAGTEVQFDV